MYYYTTCSPEADVLAVASARADTAALLLPFPALLLVWSSSATAGMLASALKVFVKSAWESYISFSSSMAMVLSYAFKPSLRAIRSL